MRVRVMPIHLVMAAQHEDGVRGGEGDDQHVSTTATKLTSSYMFECVHDNELETT